MFPLYDEDSYSTFSFVTFLLIFTNAFVFLYSLQNPDYFLQKFGLLPIDFLKLKNIYTLITSMFLHGSFWHLLGNMWFLYVFGNAIEGALGKIKYLFFYFLCGVLAGGVYCLIASPKNIPLIGASGAISGVLGGYFILFPKHKIRTIVPLFFYITVASLPAFLFLILWVILQVVFPEAGVAVGAHLVGFFAGAILVKFFKKR